MSDRNWRGIWTLIQYIHKAACSTPQTVQVSQSLHKASRNALWNLVHTYNIYKNRFFFYKSYYLNIFDKLLGFYYVQNKRHVFMPYHFHISYLVLFLLTLVILNSMVLLFWTPWDRAKIIKIYPRICDKRFKYIKVSVAGPSFQHINGIIGMWGNDVQVLVNCLGKVRNPVWYRPVLKQLLSFLSLDNIMTIQQNR